MDGIHDLGGMQGFGAIDTSEQDDPTWGVRVHGLMLALAVSGNMSSSLRPAIERMDPVHYLTSSYYEHWMDAIERIRAEAVAAGRAANSPVGPDVVRALFGPQSPKDPAEPLPRFAVGDAVVVTHQGTPGHTRCPRYVRAKRGTVVAVHAPQNLPDEYTASPPVFRPVPSYSVRFACSELFPDGEPSASVIVDLWEDYLDGR